MRNRAKCRLCGDIIESYHKHDFVACSCKEISVDGGCDSPIGHAKNFINYLSIDDSGAEFPVEPLESLESSKKSTKQEEKDEKIKEEEPEKPTRSDLLQELNLMIKNIENLPSHVMTLPINHYDFCSALLLLSAILRSESDAS